jgi:transcriptional regulator with XRE-family HTH domain/tetratricopeptide (TPR) repeat protein
MDQALRVVPNDRLKRAREHRGMTQEEVAEAVGSIAHTVSRWERGLTLPGPRFRRKLCELFGMSAEELGLAQDEAARSPGQAAHESIISLNSRPRFLDPAIPPLTLANGLIGRDDLLRLLKQQLFCGRNLALPALNGLPGVGKTALAVALAHDREAQDYFRDGILWAGLGPQPDVLKLLSRWGAVLTMTSATEARLSSAEAWGEAIHAAIGQRRMLLVIDDAWEIEAALALKVGGPRCAHLLTTRSMEVALQFAGEGITVVQELQVEDGLMLLGQLAPGVVQAEPEQARALVQAVGGLPLALTLLGNYLRVQAHGGQTRRLRAALERLQSADQRLNLTEPQAPVGRHPGLPFGMHRSLQAAIAISDQQLDEEARGALRALAVFPPKPNTFSEEAAAVVCGVPLDALDRLVDAGLLEVSGAGRYTLHQTIADYARLWPIDRAVMERMASYFVSYMEAHEVEYQILEWETSNMLNALEIAFQQRMLSVLVGGAITFARFLKTRGLYTLARRHLERAREAAQSSGDSQSQVVIWYHLGEIADRLGEYERAEEYL